MNKTEKLAYRYLTEELGYSPEDIKYNSSCSPDFVAGLKGYEVKSLVINTIAFQPRQWHYLLEHPDCYILVFKGESYEATIPMEEIPYGTPNWGKYRLYQFPLWGKPMTRQQWRDSLRLKKERRLQRVSKIIQKWG